MSLHCAAELDRQIMRDDTGLSFDPSHHINLAIEFILTLDLIYLQGQELCNRWLKDDYQQVIMETFGIMVAYGYEHGTGSNHPIRTE